MDKIKLFIPSNDSETEILCKLYWQVDNNSKFLYTVTELEKSSGLKKKDLIALIKNNSIAESTEIFCQNCETPYCFQSRADFQDRQRYIKYEWRSKDWVCEDCLLEKRKLEEKEKADKETLFKNLILETYSSAPPTIDLYSLSLEDTVYLLSLCRLCADEDFLLAKPLGSMSFHTRLSPSSKYDYEILRHLYHKEIINVFSGSATNAFDKDNVETFFLDKVHWLLPVSEISKTPKHLIAQIEEILKNDELPANWQSEKVDLWKKVALHECLEFLIYSLEEHKLSLDPKDKTIFVVNTLLEDYSVSQVYNFIWRAVRDAAAYMVRTGINRQHAANIVVGAMQRHGETAKIEKWTVKSFNRNFNCSQTLVSQVLFDVVLKIGNAGFYNVPQIYSTHNSLVIDEVQ